jgi:type IV secretion system protein VirD4
MVPVGPSSNRIIGDLTRHALILGRHIDGETNMIGGRMVYSGDRHWLIFGPNGSGKSMRLLVPNLLQGEFRSFFVIDVKGQLAAISAAHRATVGPVYVINPFGVLIEDPRYPDLQSCGFNPLAKLDPRSPDFNSAASLLAEALIELEERQPHWGISARALLATLIIFTVLEAHDLLPAGVLEITRGRIPPPATPGVPTMARVRQLLCAPAEGPTRGDEYGYGIPALALAVQRSGNDGLINKAGQFTRWSGEINSVASTARAQTEPLDDPEIAADLAKEGPDFATLKEQPASVFLVLPPGQLARHAKWLRLLVTSALQKLMVTPQPGQPPALFMLDEMAALGHMEVIEKTFALVRDYKIQMALCYQDMGQLQDIYKKRWRSFIANSGILTSFATGDDTTADWFSKRSGEVGRIIVSRNRSRSKSTPPVAVHREGLITNFLPTDMRQSVTEAESENETPTKSPLAHAHSLYGMGEGATINYFAHESNVVLGFAPFWTKIRQCQERGRDNPYYHG